MKQQPFYSNGRPDCHTGDDGEPQNTFKGAVMKVSVRNLYSDIKLKQTGMELEIRSPVDAKRFGDCYVNMKELTWCKGKVPRVNGVRLLWQDFMEICSSKDTVNAALKAAKAAKAASTVKVTTVV
jgi:hypothetical protein